MTEITTDCESTIIEVEIDKINVEILENNIDLNIQIDKNIVEIVNSTNEVIVNLEGIQGATGASNILGKSPNFTYNQDKTLAGITYANAASKTMTYENGLLKFLDSAFQGAATRKIFNYNSEGSLTSISEVDI